MRELRVSLAQPVIVFVNQMTSCCFDFFLPFEEKRERKVKDRRLWPLRAKVLFFQNLNFVVEILQNKNVSRMKYEIQPFHPGFRLGHSARVESSLVPTNERPPNGLRVPSFLGLYSLCYYYFIIPYPQPTNELRMWQRISSSRLPLQKPGPPVGRAMNLE